MPSIREFLRENAKLENQIAAITEKKSETIRVAAYASIAMHWMPEILYRFRRVCPDIDVDLRMVDHELEPFELLEKWETDVIFAARQPGFACDWTPLWNDPMCAIVPLEYPLKGDVFPVREFADKEFLMPYGRFDLDARIVFEQNGVAPRIRPCYVDDETVIRMVGKGLGLSMMAEMMIRGQLDGVRVLPVHPAAGRELGMGLHPRETVSDGIAQLRMCVLEFIRDAAQTRKKK